MEQQQLIALTTDVAREYSYDGIRWKDVDKDFEEILDTPIDSFFRLFTFSNDKDELEYRQKQQIMNRIINILHNVKVDTVQDMLRLSYKRLQKLRNWGEGCTTVLNSVLREKHLSLGLLIRTRHSRFIGCGDNRVPFDLFLRDLSTYIINYFNPNLQ